MFFDRKKAASLGGGEFAVHFGIHETLYIFVCGKQTNHGPKKTTIIKEYDHTPFLNSLISNFLIISQSLE